MHVTEDFLKKMCEGVWIEDLAVLTRPCKAWQTGSHTFHIVLTQGLNRQIRRMCRALDYHVMNLKRVRIMNIKLENLERGAYRELTGEELKGLMKQLEDSTNLPMAEAKAAGGRTAVKEQRPKSVAAEGRTAVKMQRPKSGAAGGQAAGRPDGNK